MRELSNNQNLVASNKLVKGRYKLTKEEQNFIYLMVSQIKKEDTDFYGYKIHISELENRELTQKNYKQYREFAQGLVSKTITIEDNTRILTSSWFSSVEYIKDTGCIYACFDPKLKPFLLELKKEFVQAKLPTLLQFTSKYTSRLYLFLKSEFDRQSNFKNNLFVSYEVEYLHRNFEMPKSYSKRYSNFKDKFLDLAINEINKLTELHIYYKALKTGRKITSIEFCISKKKKTESLLNKEILEAKTLSDYLPAGLNNTTIKILLDEKLGLQKHDLKHIFEHFDILPQLKQGDS